MAKKPEKKKSKATDGPKIQLAQPDRSGPSDKTLLDIAQEHNLFAQADKAEARNRRRKALKKKVGDGSATPEAGEDGEEDGDDDDNDDDDDDEDGEMEPEVEHIMDTFLWGISLAMLHFTLDVLVQHQYAMAIEWRPIIWRFGGALMLYTFLVFTLHNHPGNKFLFGIPYKHQSRVRQLIFFLVSVTCGCHLIYVTNKAGYLRVMKQAPSLGCLWIWAVIEANLGWAVVSLGINALFMWWAGLGIT